MVLFSLLISIPSTAEGSPSIDKPEIVFEGNWGVLNTETVSDIGFDQMIDLAYTIRNLTYSLFLWESNYDVKSAIVQLELGDAFLQRALNTSGVAPKKAVVYGFVASIHYSHAPALANAVLGRVITSNLGENNTVIPQTVEAGINVSEDLREILVDAIKYAETNGYNTSLTWEILATGDQKISSAKQLLEDGNITLAFKYAVVGFRTYVRAYHSLMILTFKQFTKRETITSAALQCREPPIRYILDKLPLRVREMFRARVESGEIKELGQIIHELENTTVEIRFRIRLIEKENLKNAVEMIMARIRERHGPVIAQQISVAIKRSIDEDFEKGSYGTDLATRALRELRIMLEERGIREIIIQETPRGHMVKGKK